MQLSRRLLAAIALCGLLCVTASAPSAARAQVEAGPPAPDSETLREAVAAYEANDMPRARVLFEAVHALAPTARTFRSLGLVAFRQGRYADALQLLDQSLASSVKPLTDALRADALLLREEAAGEAAAAAMASKPAGPVALAVSAPALEPAPVTGLAATRTPRGRRLKRAGYTLLGAGTGALLVSLTATAVALSRKHDAEKHCRALAAGACSEQEAAAIQRDEHLARLGRWATAGLVLGAASVAAGSVSLLVRWRAVRGEQPALAELGLAWSRSF